MTVNEMINKLKKIESEDKGDYKVYCIWTEADEDGEEYNIREDALVYEPYGKEIWITY